jgi:hypothetical protein
MITVNLLCRGCGGTFVRIVVEPADARRAVPFCDGCKPKVGRPVAT